MSQQKEERTALHCAAISNFPDVVELLLSQEAVQPNIGNAVSETIYILCVVFLHNKVNLP